VAYGWFRILESFRLGGWAKSDDVSTIDDRRPSAIGFVTEVASERQISYRVVAFPLFYELLNTCSNFGVKREFEALVGEKIVLEGAAADAGVFEVRLSHYRGRILLSKPLRSSDALLFLVPKTGEMAILFGEDRC
jgi:hypothetical protein